MLKKKSSITPLSVTVNSFVWSTKMKGVPQKLHGTISNGTETKKVNSPSGIINISRKGKVTVSFLGTDGTNKLSSDDMLIIGQFLSDNRTIIQNLNSR
ncbi:hypothetical protein H6781_01445 [Candidatus Nomurabacteria bacterium]|nr:hypothetical protein [Candidatus Kaiserbacteria bacterium]MCB9810247.1 hypothetical protein [Candidatus Nomurabacteria bacterium]